MGQIISLIFFIIGIYLIFKKMKSKHKNSIPLDDYINLSLYDKKKGYYMKKILLVKRETLQQHLISQIIF